MLPWHSPGGIRCFIPTPVFLPAPVGWDFPFPLEKAPLRGNLGLSVAFPLMSVFWEKLLGFRAPASIHFSRFPGVSFSAGIAGLGVQAEGKSFFPINPGMNPGMRTCSHPSQDIGIQVLSWESREKEWDFAFSLRIHGDLNSPERGGKKEAKPNPWSPRGNYSLNIQVHPNSRGCSLLLPFPPPKTSRILAKMLSNISKAPQRENSASNEKNQIQRGFPGLGQELGLVWLKGKLGMVGRGRQSPGIASGASASPGSRPSSRFPNIPIHEKGQE